MNIMQVDIIIKSIILIVNLLLLFTVVYSYKQSKQMMEELSDEVDTVDMKIDSLQDDINNK